MALSAATAAALLTFAAFVPPEARPRLYYALAGDLAIPVIAWFVLKVIGRRRSKHSPP